MNRTSLVTKARVTAFAVCFFLLSTACGTRVDRRDTKTDMDLSHPQAGAEDAGTYAPTTVREPHKLRIMSYNVENLFDPLDDPDTDDEAFTPDGAYRWTWSKLDRKLHQLASVISDVGEWGFPSVVGLVEVEDLEVVRALVKADPIRKADYRLSVTRGADPRGIDVALLWNPKDFKQVEAYEIPHYGAPLYYPLRKDPRTKEERSGKGRSSLWVVLEDRRTGDLYDVIVVHLPSRRGGTNSTSKKREEVNGKLNRVLDTIETRRETPRIIIMGDFNDSPTNVSVKDSLRSRPINDAHGSFRMHDLYNLASDLEEKGLGTHYFGNRLWLPDQIMVSGALLETGSRTRVTDRREVIFSPAFLRSGKGPKRSFRGTRFISGGFSDHYPVYIDISVE